MPAIEEGGTWGVLGGAFDPVHNGHLNLALQIRTIRELDGVIFVPTAFHPDKDHRDGATYRERVDMLDLALKACEDFEVCEIEATQKLSGYTLDTLRALKTTYPETTFQFIVGADNLWQLPSWHKPQALLEEFIFLVGSRPGFELGEQWQLPRDSIELIPIEPVDVSSSLVRQSTKKGSNDSALSPLIPNSVRQYITAHGLYQ